MESSRYKISPQKPEHFIWISKEITVKIAPVCNRSRPKLQFTPLSPIRQWLDGIEINSPEQARKLCQLIPSRCPFERTFKAFGRTLLYIPPLCKLNPLYDELVGLRFRALCYLADECGEDVSFYMT